MRNSILFGAILLWATVVMADNPLQPLDVKTGLWQVTAINTASGVPPIPPEMQARLDQMTPEQRARVETMLKSRFGGTPQTRTYQKCVTAKDLNANPWANGPDEKCTWTVVRSTSSDMEVRGTSCAGGKSQGMQTDISIKVHAVDSENVKAAVNGTSTGNGHTVNFEGTFTGKWLGPTCPPGTN